MSALVLAGDNDREAIGFAQSCGFIPRQCTGSKDVHRVRDFKGRFANKKAIFEAGIVNLDDFHLDPDMLTEMLLVAADSGRPVLVMNADPVDALLVTTLMADNPKARIYLDQQRFLTEVVDGESQS